LEYQKLSGCKTPVPVEYDGGDGTACGHWDEDCLIDELMTGYATGTLPLSRITVGGLEDLGYQVNYAAADPFPQTSLNKTCICGPSTAGLVENKQIFKLGGTGGVVYATKYYTGKVGGATTSSYLSATTTTMEDYEDRRLQPQQVQVGKRPNYNDAGNEGGVSHGMISSTALDDGDDGATGITAGDEAEYANDPQRQEAVAYGTSLLIQNSHAKALMDPYMGHEYIADRVVMVIYRDENGIVQTVKVFNRNP